MADDEDFDLDAVDEELLEEDTATKEEGGLSDEELAALAEGEEADAPADAGRPPDPVEVTP